MIGHEIAQLIEPLAKWGAVLLFFVMLVWGLTRKIGQGAVDRDDKEELEQLQKDRQDAARKQESLYRKSRALYDRVRARVRRDAGGGDRPAG